jgi:hypothetical protein
MERARGDAGAVGEDEMWTQRLVEAVGRPAVTSAPVDWELTERTLGVRLPEDYKELCAAFGSGRFCTYLDIDAGDSPYGIGLLATWERYLPRYPAEWEENEFLAPYRIHRPGGRGGLIPWGGTETGDSFFWLVEGADPALWPTLARSGDDDDWTRIDLPASEFIARAVLEPGFRPHGVFDDVPPSFEPYADEPGDDPTSPGDDGAESADAAMGRALGDPAPGGSGALLRWTPPEGSPGGAAGACP